MTHEKPDGIVAWDLLHIGPLASSPMWHNSVRLLLLVALELIGSLQIEICTS